MNIENNVKDAYKEPPKLTPTDEFAYKITLYANSLMRQNYIQPKIAEWYKNGGVLND